MKLNSTLQYWDSSHTNKAIFSPALHKLDSVHLCKTQVYINHPLEPFLDLLYIFAFLIGHKEMSVSLSLKALLFIKYHLVNKN